MASMNPQPFNGAISPSGPAGVIDTDARWLDDQEDMALGCECANPALQIERWSLEAAGAPNASRVLA